MSPALQRPFEFGADVILHSMTKFLNGHADVVAPGLEGDPVEGAQAHADFQTQGFLVNARHDLA